MRVAAKLFNFGYDFAQKRTKMEFWVYGDITSSLEKYLDKNVNVELRSEKRSKDCNAYLWFLLGELQAKLRIPKEEIYREYIRRCGVYQVLPIKNEAVDRFVEIWKINGYGWVCETTKSKLNGFTNVLAYYGTSQYSKEEMQVLLEQVVQDCIDNEIPTKRKEEIESLLEDWK